MTYKDIDIFAWDVPRSKVTYGQEFQWILAAQWANALDRWDDLPPGQQSYIVAAYECAQQMEAVVAYHSRRKGL